MNVMTKAQRIVLIVYCVLFGCCCLWIPWHILGASQSMRVGYGWLWAGPLNPEKLDIGDSNYAAPDLPLIVLRLLAVTAISAAVGILVSPHAKPKGG